jgi:hypothetical protein
MTASSCTFRVSSLFLPAAVALSVACGAGPTTDTDRSVNESAATTPVPAAEVDPRGSHVGVHGMVLFGSEKLYLSHIPLYSSPHNIQVVVEVKIASGVPADQQLFGTKNFTVRPTAFSLHDLAHDVLRSVTGTVYLGNFESGGTPAFRNVKFEVVRVIYQRDMASSMPRNPALDYIAVGTPTQPYFVHVIDAPPSFDQIALVKLPDNSWLDAEALEKGTLVRIDGQANAVTKRLKPRAVVSGIRPEPAADPGDGSMPPSPGTVSVEVVSENSCLPGNDFFGSCPAAQ